MHSRFSLRDFSLLCALVAIAGFFIWKLRDPSAGLAFWEGNAFLTPRVMTQLAVEVSIAATLAVGMLLVILPGHIDLSAGSGVGLLGGITAVLVNGSGALTPLLKDIHGWVAVVFGPKVAAWMPPPPWPDPFAMALTLAISIVLWWIMGMLVVKGGMQAFIVTLGGMLVLKGLFWLTIQSQTISVKGPSEGQSWLLKVLGYEIAVPQDWLHRLTTEYLSHQAGLWLAGSIAGLLLLARLIAYARRRHTAMPGDDIELVLVKWLIIAQLLFIAVLVANQYKGVPLPAVLFGAVAWSVQILTRHTRFGRYLYAIGGNEEAAFVSGIPVKRIVLWAFVLMGCIVAIAGWMQTAYAGYSTTVIGDLMELDAVAACVVGGVALKGGRGTVMGVFLGALIMATLSKGMSLMEVDYAVKYVVRGSVLVLAVWLDLRGQPRR